MKNREVVVKPIGLGKCAVVGNSWSLAFSDKSTATEFCKRKNLVVKESVRND